MEAPMHIIAKDAMLWRMEARLEVPQGVASATYQTIQQALAMGLAQWRFERDRISNAADTEIAKSPDWNAMTDRALYWNFWVAALLVGDAGARGEGLSDTPQRLDNQEREQKSPRIPGHQPAWPGAPPPMEGDTVVCETLVGSGVSRCGISRTRTLRPRPSTKPHGSGRRSVRATGICGGRWVISRGRFFVENRSSLRRDRRPTRSEASRLVGSTAVGNAVVGRRCRQRGGPHGVSRRYAARPSRAPEAASTARLGALPVSRTFPKYQCVVRSDEALPGFERAYPLHWK